MQFGVTDHIDAAPGVDPGEQLEQRLELVELYDRLGFTRFQLTEHHGTPLGLVPSPNLFLAAAAQRTEQIRLGTMISVLPLYHPVRLLEEIGMLEQLSGGRTEFGVGPGASPVEIEAFGMDPEDRRERAAETFEILVKGLTSEVLNHRGRFYEFNDVIMVVPPVQRPRPAMWAAVSSTERAAWAAQNGLSMMCLLPPEQVRSFSDAFVEAWEETGRPLEERPLRGAKRHLVIAETEAEARRIAEDAYASFRAMLVFLWTRAGLPEPDTFPRTYREYQAKGGVFAGTADQTIEFVAEQVELSGLDTMSFHLAFGGMSPEHTAQTAQIFAEQVMPAFAEVGV